MIFAFFSVLCIRGGFDDFRRVGHSFFSKERNILAFFTILYKRTERIFAFFPVLYKRTEQSLYCRAEEFRSVTFFVFTVGKADRSGGGDRLGSRLTGLESS